MNNLTSGSQAATASRVGTSSRQNTEQAAVNEFRNIFAPYSSYARSSFSACPKPTQPSNRSRRYTPYKPKDTWTHEFVCLRDPNQAVVPNKAQQLELQLAGLGRKKVTFGNKDGPLQVKEKLEKIYPKLKDAGGFEILRSGVGNNLILVPFS